MLTKKYLKKSQTERGFALLEYCAGAAIIAGIIWGALTTFGGSLSGLLGNLSLWANARSGEIQTGTTSAGSTTNK